MLPLIGITCQTRIEDGEVYDAVPRPYIKAIEESKGAPLLLPLVWDAVLREGIFALIDGLLLTGGADIDPRLYNEEPILDSGKLDRDKDDFEIGLARWALKENIPILAICRGLQLLAVAAGGSLLQDIPSSSIQHRRQGEPSSPSHLIYLSSHTRLKAIFDIEALEVNSQHHQAINDLPPGFIVSAQADDGVIEAIEKKGDHFAIGVQFHPEEMEEGSHEMQRLFVTFVSAAREHLLLKKQQGIKVNSR